MTDQENHEIKRLKEFTMSICKKYDIVYTFEIKESTTRMEPIDEIYITIKTKNEIELSSVIIPVCEVMGQMVKDTISDWSRLFKMNTITELIMTRRCENK